VIARLLLASAVAALIGCAGPQIHHAQLSALDKGMSPDAVSSRFQQPPLSVHTGSGGGRSFEFHRFRMNNGVQTDLYLLAYEKNRLVYWGYVSEFRRLPDNDLNSALGDVLAQILAMK
jgi:hypothetical protein